MLKAFASVPASSDEGEHASALADPTRVKQGAI